MTAQSPKTRDMSLYENENQNSLGEEASHLIAHFVVLAILDVSAESTESVTSRHKKES